MVIALFAQHHRQLLQTEGYERVSVDQRAGDLPNNRGSAPAPTPATQEAIIQV
jgi:hypothetical protein